MNMQRRHPTIYVALVVSLAVIGYALWNKFETNSLSNRQRVELPSVTSKRKVEVPSVKPLDVKSFADQTDFKCYNATVRHLSFPMCLYEPSSDKYISAWAIKGEYYEGDAVMKFVNLFKGHSDITFVDLGANLGTYTLPLGLTKTHVLSVEANRETARRLAKSVYLGKISDSVDLFNYAVSTEISTTYLKFDSTNRGDTFMVGNVSCPGCLQVEVMTLDCLIPFVRNKRVFIKADVQEAEIKVFNRKGAGKFFSEFEVVMVQLEWHTYPSRYGGEESKRREVESFLEFFYQRGYDVYDPVSEKRLGPNWMNWPMDVSFKRSDLPKDKLFQI